MMKVINAYVHRLNMHSMTTLLISPYINPISKEDPKLLVRLFGRNILQNDSSTTGKINTNVMQNRTIYGERSTDTGRGTAKGSLWQRFNNSFAAAMVTKNAAANVTKLATMTKRIYSFLTPISPARQYVSALLDVGTKIMYSNGAMIKHRKIYTMISTSALFAQPRQIMWMAEQRSMLAIRQHLEIGVSPSKGISQISRPSWFIIEGKRLNVFLYVQGCQVGSQ